MLSLATLIYITSSHPFPIRDCDTDGDCEAAALELGCVEFKSIRRPNVYFVCERDIYFAAVAERTLPDLQP